MIKAIICVVVVTMLGWNHAVLAAPSATTPMVVAEKSTNQSDEKADDQAPISTVDTASHDEQIRSRIAGIFSEIGTLSAVQVSTKQGVVTLSGSVANEAQADSALGIAKRTEGVVTVKDDIERTLTVQDNITPLWDDAKSKVHRLIKALPLIAVALSVLVFLSWLGYYFSGRKAFWQRLMPNPFVAEIVSQAVKILLMVVGLLLALSILGANKIMGTLLGGAGVMGIAIGFAVRDSIENYIASIMLSIRQPFAAGDHVVINDLEGIVVRLTSRATILMTLEGNHLRIPNAQVFKGIILNYSTNPERRFVFDLGIDADDDPIRAMKVGLDALVAYDFILDRPKPNAVIKHVGDSNIVIEFRAWVNQNDSDFTKARSLSIHAAKTALEQAGFALPEPIYRLRFEEDLVAALHALPKGNSAYVDTEPTGRQHPPSPARADASAEDVPSPHPFADVAPDQYLQEKIKQERLVEGESDLLDEGSPKE